MDSLPSITPMMLDPCKAVVPLQDKQEVEDDLDAILAELDGKPPPALQSGATGTAAGAAPAEEAMTTEPADASEATGVRFIGDDMKRLPASLRLHTAQRTCSDPANGVQDATGPLPCRS